MAEDDVDFHVILNKENGGVSSKEALSLRPLRPAVDQPTPSISPSELSPSSQLSASTDVPSSSVVPVEEPEPVRMQDDSFCLGGEEGNGLVSGGRWDKSLGVLCQKFIMLFLITPVSTGWQPRGGCLHVIFIPTPCLNLLWCWSVYVPKELPRPSVVLICVMLTIQPASKELPQPSGFLTNYLFNLPQHVVCVPKELVSLIGKSIL